MIERLVLELTNAAEADRLASFVQRHVTLVKDGDNYSLTLTTTSAEAKELFDRLMALRASADSAALAGLIGGL